MATHTVCNFKEVEELEHRVRAAANSVPAILAEHRDDGLSLLRRMKFGKLGRHPVKDESLNFIEQINQTFTILATLRAARLLMAWHPDADGFRLVLGPHRGIDIESVKPAFVAAEVFSAVTPDSNNKLKLDCAKMATSTAAYRYVFFHAPRHAESQQPERADAPGVRIWAVDV